MESGAAERRGSWLRRLMVLVIPLAVTGIAFQVGIARGTPSLTAVAFPVPTSAATATSLAPITDIGRSALSRTVTIEALRSDAEEFGTGWLLDAHGNFVTNAHVIEGALTIRIRDRSGVNHVGTVAGKDDAQDIAVIHSSDGFAGTPLTISPSPASPADQVIAVASGRATGHGDLTQEKVGDLHQDVPVNGNSNVDPSTATSSATVYHDMITLNGAQIFPGNSGGPVLDAQGRVVGIVTLAAKSGDQAFAIPIDRVLDRLKAFASAAR